VSGPVQEIGCPHDFGVIYGCPTCLAPRSVSTDEWVTRRHIEEHERDQPRPAPAAGEPIEAAEREPLLAALRALVEALEDKGAIAIASRRWGGNLDAAVEQAHALIEKYGGAG